MALLAVFWTIFIFLATCTNNFYAFIHEFRVSFTFDLVPRWENFRLFYPVEEMSQFEVIGHFSMFFVYMLLLLSSMKLRNAIIIGITYSIFTEYLQLHFNRGAELYEVIANLLGVMVALAIVLIGKLVNRKVEEKWRRIAS